MKRALSALALAASLAVPSFAANPVAQPQPSVQAQSAVRAKVTAIFISVTLPDGTVQNYSFDPAKTEALFFTDRSVTEMLGRFYDHMGSKTLPAATLHNHFGAKTATTLLGGQASYPLSSGSLTNLWDTANPSGVLPALMLKTPDCSPTQWP